MAFLGVLLLPPHCQMPSSMRVRRLSALNSKRWILVGLLALETFFVTEDSRLLFNEIAPRPHNSFHWSIEGCETSQFTQLIRAVAGLPLGTTNCYGTWQMDNLLGEDMDSLEMLANKAGLHVHLYGKAEAKTGRKMGHTNQQISSKPIA